MQGPDWLWMSAQVRGAALVPQQSTAASQQVQQCSSPQSCLQFWSYFGCFLHITTSCPRRRTLSNVEVRVEVVTSQLAVWADRMCACMQGCHAKASPHGQSFSFAKSRYKPRWEQAVRIALPMSCYAKSRFLR